MRKQTKTARIGWALLLAAAMLFCPLAMGAEAPTVRETVTVDELEHVARNWDYNVPAEFLWDISGMGELSVAQLRQYAKSYQLPAQYLQRFVDDHFVFKMGNDFEYIPVDFSLKLNGYNWDHLSEGYWEKEYGSDGAYRAVKVIDVSAHQGQIDWEAVKSDGVDYAFIRLGYRGYSTGKIGLDARYEENIQGAIDAGIQVGVYFYSQAVNRWEAAEEAQLVLENIRGYDLGLPVVFDIEGAPNRYARTYGLSSQRYTNIINGFCDTVENAGYDTMVYSFSKFFVSNLDMSQLQGRDLWLAQYYDVPFFPYEFKIWQYDSKGQVAGIHYNVDLNLMFIPEEPVEVLAEVEGEAELY